MAKDIWRLFEIELTKYWDKQVSQVVAIILDQDGSKNKNKSRPKKPAHRSSLVLRRLLYKKEGSTSIWNGCKTTTA